MKFSTWFITAYRTFGMLRVDLGRSTPALFGKRNRDGAPRRINRTRAWWHRWIDANRKSGIIESTVLPGTFIGAMAQCGGG